MRLSSLTHTFRAGFVLSLVAILAVPAFAGETASWKPVGEPIEFSGPGGRTIGAGTVSDIVERTAGTSGGVVCADTDRDGRLDRMSGGACISFASLAGEADGLHVTLYRSSGSVGAGTGGGEAGISVNEEGLPSDPPKKRVTAKAGGPPAIEDEEARPTGEVLLCVDLDGDGWCGQNPDGARARDGPCTDVVLTNRQVAADGSVSFLNPMPLPRDLVEGKLWAKEGGNCGARGGFPGYFLFAGPDDDCDGTSDESCAAVVTRGTATPVAGSGDARLLQTSGHKEGHFTLIR